MSTINLNLLGDIGHSFLSHHPLQCWLNIVNDNNYCSGCTGLQETQMDKYVPRACPLVEHGHFPAYGPWCLPQ